MTFLVVSDSDIVVDPVISKVSQHLSNSPGVGPCDLSLPWDRDGPIWSCFAATAIDYHFLPNVLVGLKFALAAPCFGSTIALRRKTLPRSAGSRRSPINWRTIMRSAPWCAAPARLWRSHTPSRISVRNGPRAISSATNYVGRERSAPSTARAMPDSRSPMLCRSPCSACCSAASRLPPCYRGCRARLPLRLAV